MQRLVGALMLIVLTGLPVMATTCEALCDRAAALPAADVADASMHEGMTGCHEQASTPANQRITGAAAHDCRTHDDGIRDTEAAVTGSRVAATASLVADVPAYAIVFASSPLLARSGYSPPQGPSRSHAPLVLRV